MMAGAKNNQSQNILFELLMAKDNNSDKLAIP
jgi:hypothetical protein